MLIRFLRLISDEWFVAIYLSSLLFEIYVKKKWVVFSLKSLENLKYDCIIKTRVIFNFQPLINNSVTMEFYLVLLIISGIISVKTIKFYVLLQNYQEK